MDKYNDITQFKTAGFFRRLLARVLDYFINILFGGIIFGILAGFTQHFSADTVSGGLIDNNLIGSLILPGFVAMYLSPLFIFLYSWLFTYKLGGTPGKILFGMRILNDGGGYMDKRKAFWRMTVGYAASTTFMFLGYLWIFRKKENLAWHDRFFGTCVVKVGKPIAGLVALFVVPVITIVLLMRLIAPILSGIL